MFYRNFVVTGLFACALAVPQAFAASGCTTTHLQGIYNVEINNASFQSVLQALQAANSTATASQAAPLSGFGDNPASLSGTLPGLGRYYFDGAGNIIGITPAKGSAPAVNVAVGKYTINNDCSAKVSLASGAAYDVFLASGGKQALYLRTDTGGAGNVGILRRGGSCVNLNYPGSYTFEFGGGAKQTDKAGVTGFAPYSAVGTVVTNGAGGFNFAQSLYTADGVQRSTSSGTYSVGADCSLSLKFSTAAGASSSGFVVPASFRVLMVDATTGLLSVQPDTNTTLTGTLIAQ